jgi:hypothetical protein
VVSATTTTAAAAAVSSSPAIAAPLVGGGRTSNGSIRLAERLSQRDPNALSNSVFNLPPPAQVYPPFLRGSWNVTLQYAGYLFPSKKISRSQLTANVQIPGFQKCSIASLSDVGKDTVSYTLHIDETTGLEDRATSLTTSINQHLGYDAVQQVLYNAKSNPNRLSIVFYEYRTTNAERIELFCNGRESDLVVVREENDSNNDSHKNDDNDNGITRTTSSSSSPRRQIFVCSEYIRQVTFGTGSQVGIPRQVGTNYAHFWTWKTAEKKQGSDDKDYDNRLTGNLLTAAYLDPLDPLFFEEGSHPVAIYSHVITAERMM